MLTRFRKRPQFSVSTLRSDNQQPAHRLYRASPDQSSQSDGTPEYASRWANVNLHPTKRVAKPCAHCDGVGLLHLVGTTISGDWLLVVLLPSICGAQHNLHHGFPDVAARRTDRVDRSAGEDQGIHEVLYTTYFAFLSTHTSWSPTSTAKLISGPASCYVHSPHSSWSRRPSLRRPNSN